MENYSFHGRLPLRSRALGALIFLALPIICTSHCLGEWTKTIDCTAGRVYRDVRQDAGREEFCELSLPGSLVVKDGPYRFWFSDGHPGSEGTYLNGRQVDTWKECDRFDRCANVLHEAVYAMEKRRLTFKPEIPLKYERGKYVFDFSSCRSTWVTQTAVPDPISLNIGGGYPYRCEIAYLPESEIRHGGEGDYVCWIPFDAGTRAFNSLDLQNEFPKAGLPQFCRHTDSKGEPLMIREGAADVATSVDVQCATIRHPEAQSVVLDMELNQYASNLVSQVVRREGPLNTLLCFEPISGPEVLELVA